MAEILYIKNETAKLYWRSTGSATADVRAHLLWGDRVKVIDKGSGRWKVKARGATGFISKSSLGATSLLELYFVDVGQGDGVLIRTPDANRDSNGRHILIDGGWPRRSQPTGKNVADFVDWKFKKDYEQSVIDLDAVICSHNDQDHYGGLWDLLDTSPQAAEELDCDSVSVEAIYHAGLSWWKDAAHGRSLGPAATTSKGKMFTQLLEDRQSVESALRPGAIRALQGDWKNFWREASKARTRSGTKTPIERLSHAVGALPSFEDPNGVCINVLAPVEFDVDGKSAIRQFASAPGQNTNGNSVLLRIDFGKVRILLTGDLNLNSQQSLLQDYSGNTSVFECDVAKGCHHGSGDVSLSFLKKIKPTATIISSGDSEGHDHPKPEVLAASGLTGNERQASDKLLSPLIYITELARSVALGTPTKIEFTDKNGQTHVLSGDDFKTAKVTYKVVGAGDRNAKTVETTLQRRGKTRPRQIVDFTTFGLVNVRTDGKKILIAARNEQDNSWNCKTIMGRF